MSAVPSVEAADAADAPVARGEAPHLGGGAVGAVVVHEHRFPGDAGERAVQPRDQGGDVGALVIDRDDNRKRNLPPYRFARPLDHKVRRIMLRQRHFNRLPRN